ncbi:MAG TPA: AAA family ATPase, partial [Chitinophagaceae bacterium]|nr:AAA family ATPase [Chitinophagaceae bacterium]
QVRLIRKFYNKRLLINLPRYLVVSVNTNDEQQYNIKGISISGKFDKLYNDVSKKRNRQELLLLNIFRSLVFNFLNNWNFSINYRPEELIDDFLTKLDVFIFGSVNFFLSSVNNFIGSLIADDMPDAIKGPLARISDILSATEPFLSSRSVSHDSQAFFINIVNENVGSVFAYTEKYFATESITNPLNFRLSHNQFQDTSFSSGEYALLSFFARLNWIKKKDLRENIILLIDEAELALHPYWQTQFLQTVITFLQDEFAHRKIQIIITSHSPFIVSDLPPHCIIFLEKQNGETITVDHLERHKETFGANIHQLFTEGFFLKDSLMGEFARIKIDALIKEVNAKKTFTQAEFEKLMPLIEIVGEPFIRAKLLEKMANGMLPEAIDILIRQREDELNLLKQKRNDKN